jgi:hypothetical protein
MEALVGKGRGNLNLVLLGNAALNNGTRQLGAQRIQSKAAAIVRDNGHDLRIILGNLSQRPTKGHARVQLVELGRIRDNCRCHSSDFPSHGSPPCQAP